MKKRKHTILPLIVMVLLAFALLRYLTSNETPDPKEMPYSSLIKEISESETSKDLVIEYSSSTSEAIYSSGSEKYYVEILNEDIFLQFIQEQILDGKEFKFSIKSDTSLAVEIFGIIFILVYVLLFLSMLVGSSISLKKRIQSRPSSLMNMISGESSHIEIIQESDVCFEDVAGLDEEKAELEDIVDFLKNPDKYLMLGAKIPKGVLLSGMPGTGKTLLAKALAGEAGVSFIATSGSDFIEMYVGIGASRVRNLFRAAEKNSPCIIFIDEIDAIGSKRENMSSSSEHNQTLEQLLVEMDGFKGRNDIVILAATNRPDSLDAALKRPGRFDRKIEVNLPDVKGREQILCIHGKDKTFTEDVDFKSLSYNTAGFSGAELANLLNESALITAKKSLTAISSKEIEEALRKITIGLEKHGRVISDQERRITAYHEAGHAVLGHLLETQNDIKEISIVPRGMTGGYTLHKASEDHMYSSMQELKDRLIVLLAGRAAEKIVFGDISTGASNDIEVATNLAKEMISIYGMDPEIGPISINNATTSEIQILGNEFFNSIGKKVATMLKEAEEEATNTLNKNRQFMDKLSELLLRNEKVSANELQELYQQIS